MKNNNISNTNDLVLKTKKKNMTFFIVNILLMILFFLIISSFGGTYGGGFLDYFIPGIISLIFLEFFSFLFSLFITAIIYLKIKNKNYYL